MALQKIFIYRQGFALAPATHDPLLMTHYLLFFPWSNILNSVS